MFWMSRIAPACIPLILMGAIIWSALDERDVHVPIPQLERIAMAVESTYRSTQLPTGALITADSNTHEAVEVAGVRLLLGEKVTFVALNRSSTLPAPEPPVLFYGGLLNNTKLDSLHDPCVPLYFVEPALEEHFVDSMGDLMSGCPAPLTYVLLPG